MQVFDFVNKKNYTLGENLPGTNLASTPFIGDLDDDKKIDIVYCSVKYRNAAFDLAQPLGLYMQRFATGIPLKGKIRWGGFMGSDHTGVFYRK